MDSKIRTKILSYKWHHWLKRPIGAFMLSLFNESITRKVMRKTGVDTEYLASIFQNGVWYESEAIKKDFTEGIRQYLKKGGSIFKVTSSCEKAWYQGQIIIAEMVKNPKEDIFKKLLKYKEMTAEMLAYVWLTYGFEDIIKERLEELVPKYVNGNDDEFIRAISYPSKKNSHVKFEEYLLGNKDPCWIQQNFGWMRSRDGFSRGFTVKEIIEARKKIKSEKKKKTKLVRVPNELKGLVSEVQELVYFRTLRGDARSNLRFMMRPILRNIAKHYGLKFADLKYYSVYDLAQGQPKDYKKAVSTVFYQGKIFFSNKPILKEQKIKRLGLIHGQSASKGVARGQARIVTKTGDLIKVKDGDILVAQQTFPAFIMAMQRACAFVTDEGGITCHAAIIAREMKKPCVIATKIATRALRDGDLIEVDGNQGIIRVIKTE